MSCNLCFSSTISVSPQRSAAGSAADFTASCYAFYVGVPASCYAFYVGVPVHHLGAAQSQVQVHAPVCTNSSLYIRQGLEVSIEPCIYSHRNPAAPFSIATRQEPSAIRFGSVLSLQLLRGVKISQSSRALLMDSQSNSQCKFNASFSSVYIKSFRQNQNRQQQSSDSVFLKSCAWFRELWKYRRVALRVL